MVRALLVLMLLCSVASAPACDGSTPATDPDVVADVNADALTDTTVTDGGPGNGGDGWANDGGPGNGGDPFAGLVRVDNTTCRITGKAAAPPKLKLTRVLSGTSISKPLEMIPAPGTGEQVFILSQPGRIYAAPSVSATGQSAEWLDIRSRVESGPNEAGLLGLAFAPDYASSGHFYVHYSRPPTAGAPAGSVMETVVSRFTVPQPPFGLPDASSELVIIRIGQPYGNHNGGDLAFGPDGMLYIGTGDGGAANDPHGAGQNLGIRLAKMLRIDVGNASAAQPFQVPPDNPFVGQAGALPEIWAYGLRNPWRFNFDPIDGALWVGDVGQGAREEIDIVERGGNYGWNIMEGINCFLPATGCDADAQNLKLPVADYPRTEGKSVSGGYVYRGKAIPELWGTYVFGDFVSGTLWGIRPGADGQWKRELLLQADVAVSGFGVDAQGEVYVMDWVGGAILRLDAADPGAAQPPGWPASLSETGCFADVPTRKLATGVLSYDVNSPLWSDGAAKERGLVLPAGLRMTYKADGAWELPDGSVTIKTFLDPTSQAPRPLETRFLVRDGEDWRGATYRWNEAGTEALLLNGAASTQLDGLVWHYPSRTDCSGCHTEAAGEVLGFSTGQLNRDHDLLGLGRTLPQIEALAVLGYLDGAPAIFDGLTAFVAAGDAAASAEARARAYLQANCAHCHQPGAKGNATINLRYGTALADMVACDQVPGQGDLGISNARIIAPGAPERSVLLQRMKSTNPTVRMPNLATSVPDEEAIAAVEAWISGLTGCP